MPGCPKISLQILEQLAIYNVIIDLRHCLSANGKDSELYHFFTNHSLLTSYSQVRKLGCKVKVEPQRRDINLVSPRS